MLRRRPWLYLGALVFASCSITTDTCACVLVPPAMHVVGTVSVVGGGHEVVSLATRTHRGACGGVANATLNDEGARVVSVGAYRLSFVTTEGTHCAIVMASTINQLRSTRDSVTLNAAIEADSSRLDLMIP
jgi:hypothetical protein